MILVSIFGKEKIFFLSPQRHDELWGPATFLFNGYGSLSPEAKRQGRESNQGIIKLKNVSEFEVLTVVVIRSVFWNTRPYVPLKVNRETETLAFRRVSCLICFKRSIQAQCRTIISQIHKLIYSV
jgi:hypothetical protein